MVTKSIESIKQQIEITKGVIHSLNNAKSKSELELTNLYGLLNSKLMEKETDNKLLTFPGIIEFNEMKEVKHG